MWPDFKQVLIEALKNHKLAYGNELFLKLRSTRTNQTLSVDQILKMIEDDHPDIIDFCCKDVIQTALRVLDLHNKKSAG